MARASLRLLDTAKSLGGDRPLLLPSDRTQAFLANRPIAEVDCEAVYGLIGDQSPNLLAIDTRSSLAFWRGHLPGAVNFPLRPCFSADFAAVAGASEVILYGENHDREELLWVARTVAGADRHVKVMRGGIEAWCNFGLELVRPRPGINGLAVF